MEKITTVRVEDLKIPVIIGTQKQEREFEQNILLSLYLQYDAQKAIADDAIEMALDYKELTDIIIDFTKNTRFYLVEKLADEIAKLIMTKFPVTRVSVRIDKPTAIAMARTTSVELTVTR